MDAPASSSRVCVYASMSRGAVYGAGRELIDELVMWVAARGAKTQYGDHFGDFCDEV